MLLQCELQGPLLLACEFSTHIEEYAPLILFVFCFMDFQKRSIHMTVEAVPRNKEKLGIFLIGLFLRISVGGYHCYIDALNSELVPITAVLIPSGAPMLASSN